MESNRFAEGLSPLFFGFGHFGPGLLIYLTSPWEIALVKLPDKQQNQ
jgi:hypothetical protein